MSGQFRGARGVEQLLRAARLDTEHLRIDLADIEQARQNTARALEDLSVERNDAFAGGTDPYLLGVYADAARERRLNLKQTLNSLEHAEEIARQKLSDALAEIAKLEHLCDVNARQTAANAAKKEARQASAEPARNRLA